MGLTNDVKDKHEGKESSQTYEACDVICSPVPRVIHYCWFGHGRLSDTAMKCLASWEQFAPGYEIRRYDESCFDPSTVNWTRDAYTAGRYAFVADYARFRVLYDEGGVYMDLGSELVRDITALVAQCSPFSALEEQSRTANTGLIVASPPHNPVVAEVLARYEAMEFKDDPAWLRAHTVNEMFTGVLEEHGFVREDKRQMVGGWTILPSAAFNPVYGFGGYHVKKDTYSVHHYSNSWGEPVYRMKGRIEHRLAPFIGRRPAQIIGRSAAEIRYKGFVGGIKCIFGVAHDVTGR